MSLYECAKCGSIVRSNGKPGSCRGCGGPTRNAGKKWYRIDDVDELLS